MAARVKKGLNQQELADKVGVHRSSVNLVEKGKLGARPEILRKYAKALDIDFGYLTEDISLASQVQEMRIKIDRYEMVLDIIIPELARLQAEKENIPYKETKEKLEKKIEEMMNK